MGRVNTRLRKHRMVSEIAKEPAPPRPERAYLTTILTLVSLIALCMALLGYGVAVAVEDRFLIPHASLFESSFDVISLSMWTFLRLFDSLDFTALSWDLWLKAMGDSWIVPLAVFVPMMITLYMYKSERPVVRRQVARASYLYSRIKPAKHDSMLVWIIRSMAYAVACWVAIPLTSVALLVGLVMLTFLIMLIPMLGMNAGLQHIDKFVVKPAQCKPLLDQKARLTPKGKKSTETFADCLEVTVDGIDAVKGRKVFATPSAIVLYDPVTGRAERMPVKGARITLLGGL